MRIERDKGVGNAFERFPARQRLARMGDEEFSVVLPDCKIPEV